MASKQDQKQDTPADAGKTADKTANATSPAKRTGVRFLKHGLMAKPQTVRLTKAPVPGSFAGKMDLEFLLDNQVFILSVSQKSPEWVALCAAFGDPSAAWIGATIRLQDGQALRTVNVTPIADAAGHAVAAT